MQRKTLGWKYRIPTCKRDIGKITQKSRATSHTSKDSASWSNSESPIHRQVAPPLPPNCPPPHANCCGSPAHNQGIPAKLWLTQLGYSDIMRAWPLTQDGGRPNNTAELSDGFPKTKQVPNAQKGNKHVRLRNYLSAADVQRFPLWDC